jgi:hypothetical protein
MIFCRQVCARFQLLVERFRGEIPALGVDCGRDMSLAMRSHCTQGTIVGVIETFEDRVIAASGRVQQEMICGPSWLGLTYRGFTQLLHIMLTMLLQAQPVAQYCTDIGLSSQREQSCRCLCMK